MVSKAFNLLNTQFDSLTEENSDYSFFLYNSYNDFYLALRKSAELYLKNLMKSTKINKDLMVTILVCTIIVLFASALITVPVILKVNQTKAAVLRLFLDIKEKSVRSLYEKCEI